MKNVLVKNVIKSVIAYVLISVLNYAIYVITYPEMKLFLYIPYILYIGTSINVVLSVWGYWKVGKSMNSSGNKKKDFISLSIPLLLGGTSLMLGFINSTFMEQYIFIILLSNISCGFLINICIGFIKPCSFVISLIPTMIMFISQQKSRSRSAVQIVATRGANRCK